MSIYLQHTNQIVRLNPLPLHLQRILIQIEHMGLGPNTPKHKSNMY